MSDGVCNKASAPGDREARKKTVSLLFEREIADWLEEVGGLSRKHFLTEEEQDTKVSLVPHGTSASRLCTYGTEIPQSTYMIDVWSTIKKAATLPNKLFCHRAYCRGPRHRHPTSCSARTHICVSMEYEYIGWRPNVTVCQAKEARDKV